MRKWVHAEITEFVDRYVKENPTLEDEESLVKHQVETGKLGTEMGQLLLAHDYLVNDKKFLPPAIVTLVHGARYVYSQIKHRQYMKHEVNGKIVKTKMAYGNVELETDEGERDSSSVYADTIPAMKRAVTYLLNTLFSTIEDRLIVIGVNGGRPREILQELLEKLEPTLAKFD